MNNNEDFRDPLDELMNNHLAANGEESREIIPEELKSTNEETTQVETAETPKKPEINFGDNDLEEEIAREDAAREAERQARREAAERARRENLNTSPMPPQEHNKDIQRQEVDFQGETLNKVTGMVNRVVAKHKLFTGGIPEDIKMKVMGELVEIYYHYGEQIVPEFGNLQATITNNPLPNAEDIKKTITSISQAIGYISVAGVGTGKDKNMLSYNLRQMPDSKLFNNALKAITTLGDIILKFGTLNVYSTDFDFETLKANIKSIGNAVNEMATNKGLTENLENMDTVNKTVSKLKKTCESLNSIVGLNLDFVKVGEVITGIQTFLNNVKGLKVGEATTDVVTEVNSIVTSFHNMATTLSNMKSEFNTSGIDMANGIIEGFKSIDIEGSFGTKIDNAKASLKKKSFKSVGKKFGKDVVSGFSEGISNMSSSISNQITMMYGYSTRFTDLGQYLGSAFKNAFNNQSGNINTGGTNTPTVNRGNESQGNNMKFAQGGPVYLKRGGQPIVMKPSGTDTVPAMLTPGEYVMKRSAVKNAGQSFMDKVNNMDLKGAFKELSTRYGSHVGSVVNKNVTINNNDNRVTNNSIAFNEGNERRQAIKVGRCLRGLA